MNMLKFWMHRATEDERQLLAHAVGTSRGNLDQYAGGHRQPSPARGAEFERVTAEMSEYTQGRLPKLYRTDLVESCRGCEFAAKCLGKAVLDRADFPLVESEGGEV